MERLCDETEGEKVSEELEVKMRLVSGKGIRVVIILLVLQGV